MLNLYIENNMHILPWINHKLELPSIKEVLTYGNKIKYPKDVFILRQGDLCESIFYLEKGKIKVSLLTSEGKEKTFWYALAGNIIGDIPYFHHLPTNASIITTEDCEMYVFDRKTFSRILVMYPKVYEDILKSMSNRMRVLIDQITNISLYTPIQQISRFLYFFASEHGSKENDEIMLDLNISHNEIASLNSLHRVTVTKILNQLKEEGVIVMKRNYIIIKDFDKLFNYAFKG